MTGPGHAAGDSRPLIILVMGVSGVGKTSVAKALAARLGWSFEEGDDLHPQANISKMHAGEPLTNADGRPWLEAVAAWIDGQRARGLDGVITCSALKRAYRRIVIGDRPDVRLVYLRGDRSLIAARLAKRHGHFMPASLLQSQLDTLEEPGPEEHPLVMEVSRPTGEIVETIIEALGLANQGASPASELQVWMNAEHRCVVNVRLGVGLEHVLEVGPHVQPMEHMDVVVEFHHHLARLHAGGPV